MAPLAAWTAALLATAASAHFTLDYPYTIGFDEDLEPEAPCGGYTPDFSSDNVTDFYVDGDNIAVDLLHSQGTYLFRATLDTTGASNWTQIFPEVQQSGLGYFCEPAVTVPATWAGSSGVISVAVDAPDGVLYQCAAVNFVSGAATVQQTTCTNSSGVTAAYLDDTVLATLLSDSTATAATATASTTAAAAASTTTAASGTSSESSTSTASASASSTASSAAGHVAPSVGSAVAALGLALLGSACLLL